LRIILPASNRQAAGPAGACPRIANRALPRRPKTTGARPARASPPAPAPRARRAARPAGPGTCPSSEQNSIKGNEVTNKTNEPMIHRDSITGDLLKSVKYMEAQNIKELTVKVAPKELGELTIRLTVENGIMKANITTNNESTLHIINSHLPEINQKLVDQNMQIQSFSVGISNNDMSYFNQNSQGNSGQQQNPQKTVYNHNSQEKDLGNEDVTLNTNNVDVLA
jgi:flagellar hook-length control protein FliK